MSLELEQLYPASYKNVKFLMRSSGIKGGRKSAIKQFPNTDKQSIEDLGAQPRSYRITAYITGTESIGDYFQSRNSLLNAIENKESGILVHPFYGEIQNVKAINYILNEDFTNLGAGNIVINFDIDNSEAVPVVAVTTVSEINSLRDSAIDNINNDLADTWSVNTALGNSFESARNKLEEFSSAYETAMQPLIDATDNINNLSSLITEFNEDIISLTLAPQQLSDSINNLFYSANNIDVAINTTFDSFESLFGFSTEDDTTKFDTETNNQKSSNKAAIEANINQISLAYAYSQASQLDYTTTEDVDNIIEILKNQSEIQQMDYSSSETYNSMKDLQVATFNFLQDIKKDAKEVVEKNVNGVISSRVISYQFYKDSSKSNDIDSANNIVDVSFVTGRIKVLTE